MPVRGVAGCPRIGGRRVFARGYASLMLRIRLALRVYVALLHTPRK
jgi:hypothetical protein